MILKNIKIILILFCISETSLFSQAKEEKTDLSRLSDNTQYEIAAQFYKLKVYDKALEFFKEYLEVYPEGIHRKDAYKSIANIYFNQFQYIKSIKAYNSLYEEYSNSDEGIEAYFMTGICYQKMGFIDSARRIFNSIIKEHPESNFFNQSKTKLDIIDILENKK